MIKKSSSIASLATVACFALTGYFLMTDAVHVGTRAMAAAPAAIQESITSKMPSIIKASAESRKQKTGKDADGIPGLLTDAPVIAPAVFRSTDEIFPKTRQEVQAVLSPKRNAVITATIDGRLVKFPLNNGDLFEKDDILAEYDCQIDRARVKEMESRRRLSAKQLKAYNELRTLEAVSSIELLSAQETDQQNAAVVEQARGRLNLCVIKAPFRGRVTNKMASLNEFVQTGRVLLEITSRDPLQAEFLVPSVWLRWLNIGTPLSVYIQESGKTYTAKVARIHGEVDPVSQSVQIVGEIDSYQEELLPGMSGKAIFDPADVRKKTDFGFLGLMLSAPEAENAPERK